jgi:hypothetical protein
MMISVVVGVCKPHVPVLDDIAEGVLRLLFVLYVVTFGRKNLGGITTKRRGL